MPGAARPVVSIAVWMPLAFSLRSSRVVNLCWTMASPPESVTPPPDSS